MKAFISVDLEGLPFIVIPGQLNLKGSLYDEAREIATEITLATAHELKENGFDEILIADSHGPMVNLKVDNLPEYVEIIRGNPRPTSMVLGVDKCDVAIFLGYHAKFGTAKSTFDHTYSGASIHQVKVNDIPASEFLLNAYVAGEHDVPVILVGGEFQLLKDDVEKFTPWAETVPFKQSFSQFSSKSPSMKKIIADLQEKIRLAVNNFKTNKTKPLKATKEITMKITFRTSVMADIAELLPFIKRLDGLTVEYKAKDMIDAYKIFQLLVVAASGINAHLTNIQ